MPNVLTIVAGVFFVAIAAANVVLMLESSQPTRKATARARLIAAHRVGGYLFVIFFCIMAYSMSQRLAGSGITGHLPTYLVLHIALALLLAPLILLKVLVARRYKQRQSMLKALGIVIFITAFVLVSLPALSELLHSASPGGLGMKLATALVTGVCLVQCALIFKRRGRSRGPEELLLLPETSARPAVAVSESSSGPIHLVLVATEQQTHDAKTLRFRISDESNLRAKPGQFLTFHWKIDGKQMPRSYTISSSPMDNGYVEITPKRAENGCVSVFLNEKAKPGLTVEASGPYGRFYFNERLHQGIGLVAAGSGITPMIAMIRYIDDLRLATNVRLLYFVRTAADIIFENELARLAGSLPNFKYEVCLSRPDPIWKGRSGRLSEELVARQLLDLDTPTFFLCGPRGFMDSARKSLTTLGVNQERILQESFGESNAAPEPRSSEERPVQTVVFTRSEKVCEVPAGNTLLDVAEMNGIKIPFGCRQGVCGTCVTRVLSGTVRMDAEHGLTAEQKHAGYVLPCVSRVEGTVVVAA
jgi:ferredoxin-NADP reductase